METEVFVYVDLAGTPHLAGRLWARVRKGRESATFEYDPGWLEYADWFSLEPALTLGPGPFHTPSGKSLFASIGDSAPDRWGRLLMRRANRRRAKRAGETPRTLMETDYLLEVDDEARQACSEPATMRRAATWNLSTCCASMVPAPKRICMPYGGVSSSTS